MMPVALPTTAAEPLAEDVFLAELSASAPAMTALAARLLRDPEDAREAVQEAWFRAWRGHRDVRDAAAVRGWVRAIVVRECWRVLRWRGVRRWLGLAPDGFPPEPADPALGPERAAAAAQVAARVRAAVERLPARQRLVWTLRVEEGWTLPEIAAATDTSTETVKTHLARANAALQEALHGL